jgi:serine/threonine protein kinase
MSSTRSNSSHRDHYLYGTGDDIGAYRVIGLLGTGHESDVYLVRHIESGNKYSLKLLRGRNTPQEVESAVMFYRRLARCSAVKRLRRVGVLPPQRSVGIRHYMVFDYVQGVSLDRYLDGNYQLPIPVLTYRLAQALERVHRTGLAIGDFSQGRNILVEKGTQRLLFCDLDYGEVGIPNRDQGEDLEELRKQASRLYRQIGLGPDRAVMKVLDHAITARDAVSALKPLILRLKDY